jgi:hypothetical protein
MPNRSAFTAKRMFEELSGGPEYVLTGMVKEHDTDKSMVLFTEGPDCSHWEEIDEKLIKGFEQRGQVACSDHSHHLVTLHLTRPANPDARVFARATRMGSMAVRDPILASRLGAETDCIWDNLYKVWRDPRTGQICR